MIRSNNGHPVTETKSRLAPLWSLVVSCLKWFIGLDESLVTELADDCGWDVCQHGIRVRLIERGTQIQTMPMTLDEAERFLDAIEQRHNTFTD